MGTAIYTLNAANAWGMKGNNGVFNTGRFDRVNSLSWAVQPNVNINALSDREKWWGVFNRGTPTLSYHQYAAAFHDVNPSPGINDPQDWVADALQRIFYLAVIEGIAKGGNCFGMSLEGIYSQKGRSLFSMPINRFTAWDTIRDAINVKHEYQMGESPIWWFVGEFLSGQTHDPVAIFHKTREAFACGDNPVLCVSQHFDFSGAPHCLLPISWDSSSKPWKIKLYDPNFHADPRHPDLSITRELLVNPDTNTYSYDGGGNKYSGGAWDGGRMYYMPYSLLNQQQHTPIRDFLMLLLAGTMIVVGSDNDTISLTDEKGVDLDAFGSDAIASLKSGKSIDNKFVRFKGFHGRDGLDSQVFFRMQPKSAFTAVSSRLKDSRIAGDMTLTELSVAGGIPSLPQSMTTDLSKKFSLQGREMKYVVNDKTLMASLDPAVAAILLSSVNQGVTGGVVHHQIKGNKVNGKLQYVVKNGFWHICLSTNHGQGQIDTVSLETLTGSSPTITLASGVKKTVRLRMETRIGLTDKTVVLIENLATDAANPLTVNVKPGLSGIDILSMEHNIPPNITIQSTVAGIHKSFNYILPLNGNLRIRPSTLIGGNLLKVGKIDQLFGAIYEAVMVSPH